MNVCIWGDSITWGPRLPFRVAWANLLRNHLETNSEDLHSVYDLGVDGDTTRDLLRRFDVEAKSRKPGLIIFNIGVNDSLFRKTEDIEEVPVLEFEQNMQSLINKAKAITKHVVVVGLVKGSDKLTTPLIQSTTGKSYTKKRTKLYDQSLKKIASKNDCSFIDIHESLQDQDFDDGLHPNINGHLKIFEKVRQTLDPILRIKSDTYITLVDNVDNPIGIKKIDFLNESDIIRVSALWIQNDKDEILLSKRPITKRRDPNRWSPSVACIVSKDANYLSAIKQAASDEISLQDFIPQEDIKIFISGKYKFFCQLFSYTCSLDISKLSLNPSETQQLKWFHKRTLKKLYEQKPYLFVQSFGEYLSFYLKK